MLAHKYFDFMWQQAGKLHNHYGTATLVPFAETQILQWYTLFVVSWTTKRGGPVQLTVYHD